MDVGEGALDPLDGLVDLVGVAAELLAQGQGGRVHGVGAADLDDVGELLGFPLESIVEVAQAGRRTSRPSWRRDVHGRGG
jgi:hypothetical protein